MQSVVAAIALHIEEKYKNHQITCSPYFRWFIICLDIDLGKVNIYQYSCYHFKRIISKYDMKVG